MTAARDTVFEVDPAPVGLLRVLNKSPTGVELPLWRLSCNLTKTDGGLDLAMEHKGTPHAVGGPSNPARARTAT